jgi:hypothetical protein
MSILAVFLALFLVSSFEEVKNTAHELPKAEFIIDLSWNDGSQDDIDLYVMDPTGKIVFFGQKSSPIMFLDLDNRGNSNWVDMPDGTRKDIPDRKEIVTIRTIFAGEYTVNAHVYSKRDEGVPVKVKLRLIKVNPYREITVNEVTFDAKGQEQTLLNFVVDSSGNVTSTYVMNNRLVGKQK